MQANLKYEAEAFAVVTPTGHVIVDTVAATKKAALERLTWGVRMFDNLHRIGWRVVPVTVKVKC